MNHKNLSRRFVKGFTLIELIVVIAIITILSGIISLAISGYRRDAKIESLNKQAQMVFTAFQNALIEMEINQDTSMLDVREYNGDYGDIKGAVVFFRISDKAASGAANLSKSSGIGDEIHIMTAYSAASVPHQFGGPPNMASGSVWKHGTTQNVGGYAGHNDYHSDGDGGSSVWNKWNNLLTGNIDPTMAGTYVVVLDTVDYEVRSVICRDLLPDGRDPKTGLYDSSEVPAGVEALSGYTKQADSVTPKGGSSFDLPCRTFFVENMNKQVDAARNGVYMGGYPFYDSLYE